MTRDAPHPDGLAWRRAVTRLGLWYERLLPALLPAARAGGLFLIAALLDIPARLPWWGHFGLAAATAVLCLGLLVHGALRFRAPRISDADRRLEQQSRLTHRPLAALTDRPALADPVSLALWRAHVARVLGPVKRLRLGWPHPGLAALDRVATRNAVLLGLIASLCVAGSEGPARIAAALSPPLPSVPAVRGIEIQAWITAPAYTGIAPVFLKPDQGAVSAPAGSKLTINLSGGTTAPSLRIDGAETPFMGLDSSSFQANAELTRSGPVGVIRGGGIVASWDVTVIPDLPPTAAWTEPPGKTEDGPRARFPWTVTDDYGVTGLTAEIRLAARPAAPPVEIVIPLPTAPPKSARGVHPHDLIDHPWAGLEVTARLTARDSAGQAGISADAILTLPERQFHNEIAKILIEIRKALSLHPDERDDELARLDDLLQHPEQFGSDSSAYVNLSAIYFLMVRGKAPDMVAEAQERLWNLALYLEEGQTEETARALEVARQAVRDAMDRLQRDPTEANRADLDQKLAALREAIERHLQALTQQAMRDHELLPFDPRAEHLTDRDLGRLTEEAEQAAREGRMDEAREKMAELERLLDRLKQARADRGHGNSESRQKARQQMGAAQDLMGREAGLLDRTEGRSLPRTNPRGAPPRNPDGSPSAEQQADQAVQRALRGALGEMMQQFGDLTGEIPQSLGEADMAMRDGMRALSRGQDDRAAEAERRAIEALQKGAREMGQTLARKFGRGRPGGEGDGDEGDGFGAEDPMGGGLGLAMPDQRDGVGDGVPPRDAPRQADRAGRDPLGRPIRNGSGLETGDVSVPEEAERLRARSIQDELRRREGERERPVRELDYIERLLKRF